VRPRGRETHSGPRAQNFPDARHRSQPVERLGIVAFRLADDGQLEVNDEGVVVIDEGEVPSALLLRVSRIVPCVGLLVVSRSRGRAE